MADKVTAENDEKTAPSPVKLEVNENKENVAADEEDLSEPDRKLVEGKMDSSLTAEIDKVTSDLLQSRSDLLGRVQNLKKELQDWRGKLDTQVKSYRLELGELRSTLNSEVEQLRDEFQALRTTLKRQLDATSCLSDLVNQPSLQVDNVDNEKLASENCVTNSQPSSPQ